MATRKKQAKVKAKVRAKAKVGKKKPVAKKKKTQAKRSRKTPLPDPLPRGGRGSEETQQLVLAEIIGDIEERMALDRLAETK